MYAVQIASPGKYADFETVYEGDFDDCNAKANELLAEQPPYTLVRLFNFDTNATRTTMNWR